MNSSNNGKTSKAERALRNRVARAVFASAESMGISDRDMIEELADQVIERLYRVPSLPGMEDLAPEIIRPVPDTEIKSIAKSILNEKGPEAFMPATEKEEQAPVKAPETRAKRHKAEHAEVKVSPNARAVLERRYLMKDNKGRLSESVEDLLRRVAHHVALADLLYDPTDDTKEREEEFYQAMANLEFLPNSPTLMNAGRELGQLSACFVLPIEDSMESIFDSVKYTALIHKSGGGTGFSFSRLRPEGDAVGSTGGVASGPVSFMRAFDAATDVIKQGGKRRGANMAILNVDHPDILKFITSKEDNTSLTNFNISVAVTEDFMKAVEDGRDYELVNPHTKKVVGKLNAKDVFDRLVDNAWRNGDPGIVFLDRVNRDNPTPKLGSVESTNPCGEQPLLPYESCNLGSINLSRMVCNNNGKTEIDYVKLAKLVRMAVRFLDNVIDVNKFPLPEIHDMTRKTRKIGLGVMGFADILIQLGIPYNSQEALDTAEALMKFISDESTAESQSLATERGVFPALEGSTYDMPDAPRVRNATRTTIAPTGTLSIIAGCSSGIEPLFALSYTRTILEGTHLVEINPLFEEVAKKEGFYSESLTQELAKKGNLRDIEGVPERIKQVFVTSHDISPEWHVRMQAAFQKYTDNAVSKTVNFPHDATREDVAHVYMLAYREGCKGITIYRDGSREGQVLSISREETVEETKLVPKDRPTVTTGITEKVATGCGNLYITVNFDDEHALCEVFCALGKAGGCASAQLEAITRLISLALRSGVEVESIIKHLKGIRCPQISWDRGHAILSCPDAIAGVLERHKSNGDIGLHVYEDKSDVKPRQHTKTGDGISLLGQCPDCGGLLIFQEGCLLCPACGYTKC
ncbi:MAG: vitamin B12-dependent ribonucleotide reductase [Chloroflexota bacterium]|nr:vitamin B12-dependent ribonucleotide reductase [Chloroflexota bacterium]